MPFGNGSPTAKFPETWHSLRAANLAASASGYTNPFAIASR
jgi:hypothetical protein